MRFLSQDDPALSNAQGEPLGSNLYAYCVNNPAINSDPNGFYTRSSPKQKSWIFKLAEKFGINLQTITRNFSKVILPINIYLVKLYIYVTVGLTKNDKAGISFNYSKKMLAYHIILD